MGRIRKGDLVFVLSGKDRGKTGKVLQVWPGRQRALVERVNLMKHFERPTQQNQAGGVVEREGSMALAKLAPLCAKCRKPSRVGWEISGTDQKRRICRRCKGAI